MYLKNARRARSVHSFSIWVNCGLKVHSNRRKTKLETAQNPPFFGERKKLRMSLQQQQYIYKSISKSLQQHGICIYMKRLLYPTGRKVHAYVCILPQKCASEKILSQVINYSTFRRTDEGKVSPVFFYENCALLLEKEKHITYLMNGSKHFN